ncbi:2,3-diketo-L-gulonate TRAP transporter small permease protein YiaM [Roseovarius sp. THAF8]|uniref:TRAP transporter small permease protein n=1 Tax=Roseovarius atlanticus TaxID=1641875 RepID=A0A0T5NXM3_9RHOB|nr:MULTISPECIES: TRAP transporter small permease [Roseovarius]KRS13671.1 C4-dicarboxylate ABC transporter permease [Roseovarius atlanticus]QFT98531.1 2,3-diketo-L-gulonate TRAP transporter small permease protein YiaM [Roseovarius sp. THAF8]
MKRLEHIFVVLNGWALIGMLSAMALIVGANIFLRYFTAHSLPWADEAARYLMIWLTFTGAGLILRIGGHVAITNLQDSLPATGQKLLRALIVLILLTFFAYMVYVGWQYAQRMQFQVTPALRLPFLYVYAAMPVGFALLIVHLLLIARPFIGAGDYKSLDARGVDDDTVTGGANG